jgi:hypothetical protein
MMDDILFQKTVDFPIIGQVSSKNDRKSHFAGIKMGYLTGYW